MTQASEYQFPSKGALEAKLKRYRAKSERRMAVGGLPFFGLLVVLMMHKLNPNPTAAFSIWSIVFGVVMPVVLTMVLIRFVRPDIQAEDMACQKCGKNIADGISGARTYVAVNSGCCPACGCKLFP